MLGLRIPLVKVSSSRALQIAWLSLISWAVVASSIARVGTNVVTLTYQGAAEDFIHRISPYANVRPGADVFKYSPVFAWLYSPLAWLPSAAQALMWSALNVLVFWTGVSMWFVFDRADPSSYVGFALTSLELDGSLRYQQVNPLLLGLTLVALAVYRNRRPGLGAALLSFAANLKLLPALFLGLLAWPFEKKYWTSSVLTMVGLLLLPTLYLGWSANLNFHMQWAGLIHQDLGAQGLLDIQTVLTKYGWPQLGRGLRWGVLVVSLIQMFRMRTQPKFDPVLFWALGLLSLVVWSPRTESPTFVLMAPTYLAFLELRKKFPSRVRVLDGVFFLGAFLVSISFNDIWPKAIWNPLSQHYATKALGALVLWSVFCVISVFNLRIEKRPI